MYLDCLGEVEFAQWLADFEATPEDKRPFPLEDVQRYVAGRQRRGLKD
jgi:hypothetical protein